MFLKIMLDRHSLKNAVNYDGKQVDNINVSWKMLTAARKEILKKHNDEQIDDFKIKLPKKTQSNGTRKNQKPHNTAKTVHQITKKNKNDQYCTKFRKSEPIKKEIKVIESKLRRLNRKKQFFSVTKKTHEQKNVLSMLRKSRVPIFKVVPQRVREAPYKRRNFNDLYQVKVVNDIMVYTSQYFEPSLHFIVKYPNQSPHSFNYSNNCLQPQVKELPNRKSLCRRKILHGRRRPFNIKSLCGRKNLGSKKSVCGTKSIINPKINMNTQEKNIDRENVTNNNDYFITYCHDKFCTAEDMNGSISNENMTSTEKLRSLLQQLEYHLEYLL